MSTKRLKVRVKDLTVFSKHAEMSLLNWRILCRIRVNLQKLGGYIFEHRLVIEKYIKRYLGRKESVHHLDEIKSNNAPNNLMAFTSESAHQRFHKDPNNVRPEEIIFDGRIFKILN